MEKLHWVDWSVIAAYCLAAVGMGVWLSRRASKGTEEFFLSGRSLPWWLAGTSMVATSFASDTPLFVTGIVRSDGIWKNWLWWGLGISTIFAVFFFSRLWRRAKVVTEVELTELRYSGGPAAALRGFKALYMGLVFNCYVMGGLVFTGLVKVMEVTTCWDMTTSLFFCVTIAVVYSVLSGFWGVVATDFIQFIVAVGGAILLAVYAVSEAGGLDGLVKGVEAEKLQMIPPGPGEGEDLLFSPLGWLLALVLVQWWAWKNSDGGGIIIQRMSACRNEREAVYATLWFNIAHYALRSWPWILVGLASLVVLTPADFGNDPDPEKAYPLMIMKLLPTGLKGLLVASFFAAFMSTADTHMNWGSSYVLNDFYRRFVRKEASEKHYLFVSRVLSLFIVVLAVDVAYYTDSIKDAFVFILHATAGIGVVLLARWFWWRVNAWSEISVMLASVPAIMLQNRFFEWMDYESGGPKLFVLLYMVGATALIWVPVTLLTRPVSEERLKEFYRRVRPPGPGWARIRKLLPDVEPPSRFGADLFLWAAGCACVFGLTFGIGEVLLGSARYGLGVIGGAGFLLWFILDRVRRIPVGEQGA